MKIAHVSPEYYPAIGGVGQVVRELAERQAKVGHEVHVFAPDWDKKTRVKKREEIIERVHVHRCYHLVKMANFNTFWPSVLFRLIKGKFDIIHSHNFGHVHAFLSAIASLISKAKHIHTTHCPWSDAQRSLVGRLGVMISYNLFSRLVLSTAYAIIATPVNGVSFEIETGKNGYLINHGNIQGFAEKINYILNNPKTRKKVAATNVQKAEAYNWDIIAKKTTDLYLRAIKNTN